MTGLLKAENISIRRGSIQVLSKLSENRVWSVIFLLKDTNSYYSWSTRSYLRAYSNRGRVLGGLRRRYPRRSC